MNRNVDFKRLSNAEINLKMMGYDNDYSVRKEKIIQLIHELEDLDFLYNKAKEEIERRGVLRDE